MITVTMERLPSNLIAEEILLGRGLDVETLCRVACVCKSLRCVVDSLVFPLLSSLDLSSFSLDPLTLHHVLSRCSSTTLEQLSLSCHRLPHNSLAPFLSPHVKHLNLSRCSLLSPSFLSSVGRTCPFLKSLVLELPQVVSFSSYLARMLGSLQFLECLCIRVKGAEVDGANALHLTEAFLPPTLKTLMLKPMLEQHAITLAAKLSVRSEVDDPVSPVSCAASHYTLQCLSLVLDVISDRLLFAITTSLPLLVDLQLEDRPNDEPLAHRDLTNAGLQSLGSCHHLAALSLIRSRKNYQGSFKRVNDMGIFLLSETCNGLQSLTLVGFSKVSDAGFASLLNSCQQLKRFEIRNATTLSDLAFHNLTGTSCALVEVRLLSCNLITSETVNQLAFCRSLEVLDLCGCKSVANSCIGSISCLQKLTALNLTGADITDSGLSVIGQGSPPISHLYLRACKRVTDKGISLLLLGGGTIGQTLTTLDLGYMPGISDEGICTVAAAATHITDLCIRCCYHVTDFSLQVLSTRTQVGSKELRTLDLFNCIGLKADALKLFRMPWFRGIRWIGLGQSRLARRNAITAAICKERPWLTLCFDGCEMGCQDGWHYHKSQDCR